ncbi:MAG: agglutinin biogenesis protein MshI [Paucibacter sp.]|nr:agglutinin biogenesis protein MshI [Roseateles sp.]
MLKWLWKNDRPQEEWVALVEEGGQLDWVRVLRPSGQRPQVRGLGSVALGAESDAAWARLSTAQRLKRANCTTLLPESDYRLVLTEAPAVPSEEAKQALRWRLKDAVDFPIESAAVDVVDLPPEAARQASVFAVAAAESVIARHMRRCHQARIGLEAIDIAELALRNVAALFEEPNRGVACLLAGQQGSLLVITFKGALCLTRRFDATAASLSATPAEFQTSPIERLVLEMQRTLDNFDRQHSLVPVSRLLVVSDAGEAGLVAALKENLYLPVEALDLARVVDFTTPPEEQDPARRVGVTLAVGAALRGAA